ncbi:hrp65 protein-like isoform X2 [Neocloeon triangulifer]|uniref:hrp65 protein-like isoform X2 n=1 Tax=Neocloeon triangulifer TaxID=2078957 RepID=UPI00286F4D6A|nr:hrp65 protein-like isoform X2 [Neocloeon triangulifer]
MRGMFRGNMMRGRGGPRGGGFNNRFSGGPGPMMGGMNKPNPLFENQQKPPNAPQQNTQQKPAQAQQPQPAIKPLVSNPQQQNKPQGQQQNKPLGQPQNQPQKPPAQSPKPAEKKVEAPVKAEAASPAVKQTPAAAQGGAQNQQKTPQQNQQPPMNQQPFQQRGPPNLMQQSPNLKRGPNQMQGGPNQSQGGPNQNQGSPNQNQGGPNQNQGGFNQNQGGFNQMQGGPNRPPFNQQERGPHGGGGGKFNPFNRPFQGPRGGGGGPRTMEERLNERVAALSGPTFELPPKEGEAEVKFSGHCRLYVGNITADTSDEDIKNMFTPYGEPSEIFVNKDKNFAFVKMDYRASAEKARRELDGTPRRGKVLKIRFAPHGAIIKVRNLTPYVSNELLETAFSVFGEIERAYIITDERGKSTGAGIVEFQRKPAAVLAVRKCNENCFFLTSALRPAIVEMHEEISDPDGLPDKSMFKKSNDFMKEREMGPRFANINSFEHDYGTRWKQLFELRKQKLEAAEREMKLEEEKLEAQMEYAKYEHETEMLRNQLRQREQDRDRQKRDWEMKERQQEERKRQDEEMMRRKQEEMQMRIVRQEEDMRRRQAENTLFMQAHQLNNLLDKQEQAMLGDDFDSPMGGDGFGGPGNLPVDPKAFMDTFDRGSSNNGMGGYDDADMMDRDMMGERDMDRGRFNNGNRGRWGGGNDYQSQGSRRGDDFPNKRPRRH